MLQSVFNIRPGEGRKVAVMFLYFLFIVAGIFVIGRAISRSLFLSSLPKEAIAYRFILPPLVIMLVMAPYARLARRYSLTQLIMGSTIFMIAGVLIFRLLLETPYGDSLAVLAALFVFFQIIAVLASTQFWTLAGEVFDPRQGKRLFGLISAGGPVANVVGGAGLTLVATLLAPKNLIFILVLCLIGCIACVWTLKRKQMLEPAGVSAARARPDAQPKQRSVFQDLIALRQSPLLVVISGIAILIEIVVTLADYQLDLALKANFAGDASQISAFLGVFFFWAGLAACFIQFFVTGRVLARFGITAALLFTPVGYALGAMSVLITGGVLWAAALPRAADVVFRYTINEAAANMLYLPIPTILRKQAKTLVQGMIIPPAVALIGLIFLFVRGVEGLTIAHLSIPILLLIVLWVILVFRAHRQYTQSLTTNLTQYRLGLDELSLDLNDETTVQALIKTLQHPDEMQVISALQLLSAAPQIDWLPHLKPLLSHPSAEVRVTAIKALARLGGKDEAEWLKELCYAPEEAVRAEAIEAYCTLDKEQATTFVIPFLDETSPGIKRAALVNLIRYGGMDGILPAVEQLKSMVGNDQLEMRLEAARALGALQIPTFYQPLLTLFDDPQREVQMEAIRAAGAIRAPKLAPHLIHKLGQLASRQAASEALVQFGSSIEPLLAQTLEDPTTEQSIRLQVPQVLQCLGSPQAAAILLDHLKESDRLVRGAIFAALTRLRDAGVAFKVKKDLIYEALMLEFGYYYEVYVWRAELNVENLESKNSTIQRGLLAEVLTVRLNERLDRIFFLLELLYSVQTIDAVKTALNAKDGPERANAIELLDNMVDREIKVLLLPLIEAPPEQVLEIARQRFRIPRLSQLERLADLARYPDPWLRSCAIFEIGQLGPTNLTEPVLAALHSDNALVRETALVACSHLLDANRFKQVLMAQTVIDEFPQVRQYAQALLQPG
jgi:ATP:ADP antiporter, AAA family